MNKEKALPTFEHFLRFHIALGQQIVAGRTQHRQKGAKERPPLQDLRPSPPTSLPPPARSPRASCVSSRRHPTPSPPHPAAAPAQEARAPRPFLFQVSEARTPPKPGLWVAHTLWSQAMPRCQCWETVVCWKTVNAHLLGVGGLIRSAGRLPWCKQSRQSLF